MTRLYDQLAAERRALPWLRIEKDLRHAGGPRKVADLLQGRRQLIVLCVVRHAAPALRELYEAPLALVRPDQIVAWRGRDAAAAHQVLLHASGH